MTAARALRQRGLALAELMVAMTIGLLILAGLARLFASANNAYAAQADAAQADEGGRYALEVIGVALRQAAYVDWSIAGAGASDGPARLAGLDAKSISKATEGIANPLPAAVNGSDVLSVRFAGAGKAPRGDGSMLNCAGFGIPQGQEGWSIFYVARGTDGAGELRCKYRASGGGWSADALIDGVDGFQVLYGLDTDEPRDGVPNRYVSASSIDALDSALVLAGASDEERQRDRNRRSYWKRVVSVQLALLLRGAKRTGTKRSYDLFGPAYSEASAAADPGVRLAEAQLAGKAAPRERRLFATTVALRGGAR